MYEIKPCGHSRYFSDKLRQNILPYVFFVIRTNNCTLYAHNVVDLNISQQIIGISSEGVTSPKARSGSD